MVVIRLTHKLYKNVPPEGTTRVDKSGLVHTMKDGRWEVIGAVNNKPKNRDLL